MSLNIRFVRDVFGQPSHQHAMVHAVEEGPQIHAHHPLSSFLHVQLRLRDCVVSTAVRSKAMAVRWEGRVESRLQDLQNSLLDTSFNRGWNAELKHSHRLLWESAAV